MLSRAGAQSSDPGRQNETSPSTKLRRGGVASSDGAAAPSGAGGAAGAPGGLWAAACPTANGTAFGAPASIVRTNTAAMSRRVSIFASPLSRAGQGLPEIVLPSSSGDWAFVLPAIALPIRRRFPSDTSPGETERRHFRDFAGHV